MPQDGLSLFAGHHAADQKVPFFHRLPFFAKSFPVIHLHLHDLSSTRCYDVARFGVLHLFLPFVALADFHLGNATHQIDRCPSHLMILLPQPDCHFLHIQSFFPAAAVQTHLLERLQNGIIADRLVAVDLNRPDKLPGQPHAQAEQPDADQQSHPPTIPLHPKRQSVSLHHPHPHMGFAHKGSDAAVVLHRRLCCISLRCTPRMKDRDFVSTEQIQKSFGKGSLHRKGDRPAGKPQQRNQRHTFHLNYNIPLPKGSRAQSGCPPTYRQFAAPFR